MKVIAIGVPGKSGPKGLNGVAEKMSSVQRVDRGLFLETAFPCVSSYCRMGPMGQKMGKQSKLLLLNRKEVFLIFIFIICLVVTSFMGGVQIGQRLGYLDEEITVKDRELVQLKSWVEEDVEDGDEGDLKVDKDAVRLSQQKALKEKFEQIAKAESLTEGKSPKKEAPKSHKEAFLSMEGDSSSSSVLLPDEGPQEKSYKGKWTIQLGSYKDIEDAQRFADGFKVRGYNPIINEVGLEGRGVWYRVGLGAFDNVAEAKQYITEEQTLFQGQDYTIVQLQ